MTPETTRALTVLGIETSCDETAAAVVRREPDGRGEILSDIVLSQTEEHAGVRRRRARDRRTRACGGARRGHPRRDGEGRDDVAATSTLSPSPPGRD